MHKQRTSTMMSAKKRDLEIVYNLLWKNRPQTADDRSNIVGMYDIPSTTLTWENFKSYLLKNSGSSCADVKVSYIDTDDKEVLIESSTDFQLAMYSFRKRARVGDIITLKLDKGVNSKKKKDICDKYWTETPEYPIVAEETHIAEADVPPEWFLKYMKKFKRDLLEDLSTVIAKNATRISVSSQANAARKVKAEPQKKSRKLTVSTQSGAYATSDELKKFAKMERKLEKLDLKSVKLNSKKIALKLSDDTDSCLKNRLIGLQPSEKTVLMDAMPIASHVPTAPHMLGGETYLQQWKVINNGSLTWSADTELRFAWGSESLTPVEKKVLVPHLMPGEEGLVSVLLEIPVTPGIYECYWHFHHEGTRFGHWLGCQVIVDEAPLKGFQSRDSAISRSMGIEEWRRGIIVHKQCMLAKKEDAAQGRKSAERSTVRDDENLRYHKIDNETENPESLNGKTKNATAWANFADSCEDAKYVKKHTIEEPVEPDESGKLFWERFTEADPRFGDGQKVFESNPQSEQPDSVDLDNNSAFGKKCKKIKLTDSAEVAGDDNFIAKVSALTDKDDDIIARINKMVAETCNLTLNDISMSLEPESSSVQNANYFDVNEASVISLSGNSSGSTGSNDGYVMVSNDGDADDKIAESPEPLESAEQKVDNVGLACSCSESEQKPINKDAEAEGEGSIDENVMSEYAYIHYNGDKIPFHKKFLSEEYFQTAEKVPVDAQNVVVPISPPTAPEAEKEEESTAKSQPVSECSSSRLFVFPQHSPGFEVVYPQDGKDQVNGFLCSDQGLDYQSDPGYPTENGYVFLDQHHTNNASIGKSPSVNSISVNAGSQPEYSYHGHEYACCNDPVFFYDAHDYAPAASFCGNQDFSSAMHHCEHYTSPPHPCSTEGYNCGGCGLTAPSSPPKSVMNESVASNGDHQSTVTAEAATPTNSANPQMSRSFHNGIENGGNGRRHVHRPHVWNARPDNLITGAAILASSAMSTARSMMNMVIQSGGGRWVNGHWVAENTNTKRESGLQLLGEMGFVDRDLNATLMARYNDDVHRVISELVQ